MREVGRRAQPERVAEIAAAAVQQTQWRASQDAARRDFRKPVGRCVRWQWLVGSTMGPAQGAHCLERAFMNGRRRRSAKQRSHSPWSTNSLPQLASNGWPRNESCHCTV